MNNELLLTEDLRISVIGEHPVLSEMESETTWNFKRYDKFKCLAEYGDNYIVIPLTDYWSEDNVALIISKKLLIPVEQGETNGSV